jgi:hypothetical protein
MMELYKVPKIYTTQFTKKKCMNIESNDGYVLRNTKVKVKASASVFVFMLWCGKRVSNGVLCLSTFKGGE